MQKIVPDTSIVVDGILTELIEDNKLQDIEIIIPYFVMEELRSQAGHGRSIGMEGLHEIKKLRELSGKNENISLRITGRRQTVDEIKLAKAGRIDALIIDIAKDENAILYTSDRVQALAAEAEGLKVKFYEPYKKKTETALTQMMTEDTMSLHLKENQIPLAKKGTPGNIQLVSARDNITTKKELENIIQEIMDAARYEEDAFIELAGYKATVVQLGNMRIAIARPPFSDTIEITVVRPIIQLNLDDYKLSSELKQRLTEKVEGVLIAGAPGSGKSTFAAAIANYFNANKKIVKTFESPRDLQVDPGITQYTKLHGSFVHTADMLLLVRPDYTIFDEVRKTEEFEVFADMRLAGIGMLGVVHATKPIDAIQRFLTRSELGMIPHIIDTVIFIEDGQVAEVLELSLTVRVPSGMIEADLARPVVEVKDFKTKKLVYEIYTYGEENIIIPVKEVTKEANGLQNLAKKQLLKEIRNIDSSVSPQDIQILSENKVAIKVRNELIPRLIGTKGKNIKALEEYLGIGIDVQPKIPTMGQEIDFDVDERGNTITFAFDSMKIGNNVSFYVGDVFLFSATIGNKAKIRVSKSSELGRRVMGAIMDNTLNIYV